MLKAASTLGLMFLTSILAVSSATATTRSSSRDSVSLEAFKDDLFTNQDRHILESRDKGMHVLYDWNYQESVLDRDQIEGEVAKQERVDPSVATYREDLRIQFGTQQLEMYKVGADRDAKFAVIFIHGGGGTKDIGASDVRFGANFNHVQSLALRNNGLYLSPTLSLDENGGSLLIQLIEQVRASSKKAKVIVACGSAGAVLCSFLASSPIGASLGGLIYLSGTYFPPDFSTSPAARAKVPVIFSQGSKDPLVPLAFAEQNYEVARSTGKNYPVRLEIYNGGKHGTPMRLIDWKSTLEWMLSEGR